MQLAQRQPHPARPVAPSTVEAVTKNQRGDRRFSDRAWTLPHRVDIAKSLAIRSEGRDDIVVSRVVRASPDHGMTEPQAKAEAYSARLYLGAVGACDAWCDGRPFLSPAFGAGGMMINDMRHEWRADSRSPFDTIHFFIPQAALDALANGDGGPAGGALYCPVDPSHVDNVFNALASSFLPALDKPAETNNLFLDHLSRAVIAHLASHYGTRRFEPQRARGGLAPWQERRAKEILIENLAGDVKLADLAGACRLSPSHFSQAFRRTVGCPPHKWLLKQRVERAKQLMVDTRQSLSEIALETGFADQSHLTRVFSQHLGESPAAWRRAQGA